MIPGLGRELAADQRRSTPIRILRYPRWAIAAFSARLVAVILDQFGVIYVFAKRLYDGIHVSSETVRRDLVRSGIDCRPSPNVASYALCRDLCRYLLLLAAAERSNLIDLDALAGQVA